MPRGITNKKELENVPPLSDRENEIAQLVAQGCRNKEVAVKLSISEQTVKNHLYKIFGKLRVFNRRELRKFGNCCAS